MYYVRIILLKNKSIDPARDSNKAIGNASAKGVYDIVRLLLNDPRVDPSTEDNTAILDAYDLNYIHIVNLLWEDQRIKNTLNEDNPVVYNELFQKDVQEKIKGF